MCKASSHRVHTAGRHCTCMGLRRDFVQVASCIQHAVEVTGLVHLYWVSVVPMHSMGKLVQPLHWRQSGLGPSASAWGNSLAETKLQVGFMHAIIMVFCLPHTCCGAVASLCRGCGMGGLQDSCQSLHIGAAVHWDLHVQGKSLMLAVLSFGAAWL